MANNYFRFRQFTIWQGNCAMKVGTDGTLLGAWAHGGGSILDIGTGTGLIALMMAQRFSEARVVGIDVDRQAIDQARQNVCQSPFSMRIELQTADVNDYQPQVAFDAIVSNPPFFDNSLLCPDGLRTIARHTVTLTYASLMSCAYRLLSDSGEFSLIVPAECLSKIESAAVLTGFFRTRLCAVKTTPTKPVRRYLLAFAKHPASSPSVEEGVIETLPGCRSDWYQKLTKDFYL